MLVIVILLKNQLHLVYISSGFIVHYVHSLVTY